MLADNKFRSKVHQGGDFCLRRAVIRRLPGSLLSAGKNSACDVSAGLGRWSRTFKAVTWAVFVAPIAPRSRCPHVGGERVARDAPVVLLVRVLIRTPRVALVPRFADRIPSRRKPCVDSLLRRGSGGQACSFPAARHVSPRPALLEVSLVRGTRLTGAEAPGDDGALDGKTKPFPDRGCSVVRRVRLRKRLRQRQSGNGAPFFRRAEYGMRKAEGRRKRAEGKLKDQ
jgi:hypothetical protein